MRTSETMKILNDYKQYHLNGMTRKQIQYEFNELNERTDGSITDGLKIGYLYSLLYER